MRRRVQGLLGQPAGDRRRGLTLVELLVVVVIIILVSAVALPTALPALAHRQVSEAGRILQGALVGARDKAIHDGQPSGIRLLPDPSYPVTWTAAGTIDPTTILAYNRVVPIDPAPEYTEGLCTPVPIAAVAAAINGNSYPITPHVGIAWPNVPYNSPAAARGLILAESPADPGTLGAPMPNAPTSWFWNVRVGDQVQLNNAGPWYTVIGPMNIGPKDGNAEMFVNAGNPAPLDSLPVPQVTTTVGPNSRTDPAEYLVLVNGRDDNGNGWADEQWDGVDNDGLNGVDDPNEFEQETWLGAVASTTPVNVTYTIRRRPSPSANAREVALPTSMVIDATSWDAAASERSRLPVSRFTGCVDILLNPDGTVSYNSPYGVPSSFGLSDAFYHFWLAERQDLSPPSGTASPLLPVQSRGGGGLKGRYSLLTLFARTGQIVVADNPKFDDPTAPADGTAYDPGLPYRDSRQGVR